MITTSKLKAINRRRDNVLGIIAIMAVPAPFIGIGGGAIVGGIKDNMPIAWLVGIYIIVLGCVIGWVLFQSKLELVKESYIVFIQGKKAPVLAYPTAEWHANEALEYLISDE